MGVQKGGISHACIQSLDLGLKGRTNRIDYPNGEQQVINAKYFNDIDIMHTVDMSVDFSEYAGQILQY
jgi:hypothetical protein